MITAVYYDQPTGRISRQLTLVNADEVNLNLMPGEGWIEGECDLNLSRVVQGQIVPREAADIEAEMIAAAWSDLRSRRANLLALSDWTQIPDAPVNQVAWAAYRQALRDLPAVTEDPLNPPWPVPPASR